MLTIPHFAVKKLHIEPSSLCQAFCNHCPRILDHNKVVKDDSYISWDSYKQHILPYLSGIEEVTFCGNFGDPMTNPDMVKIAVATREAIVATGQVKIMTNGGIGKAEDYYFLTKSGVQINFAVEGTSQEIHERYRQNVKFSQLYNNIQAAARGYASIAISERIYENNLLFYVIGWQHTIDDLANIVEFARSVKADILFNHPRGPKESTDWNWPNYNPEGKLLNMLTRTSRLIQPGIYSDNKKMMQNSRMAGTFQDLLEFDWGERYPELPAKFPLVKSVHSWKDIGIQTTEDERFNVYQEPVELNCEAKRYNELFIGYNMLALPCCHIGTQITYATNKIRNLEKDKNIEFISLQDKFTELNGLNLFDCSQHPLDTIFASAAWADLALDHIEGTRVANYCEKICGRCNKT
jgi:molybdenum cofactor biosynthesis enzyme MoaA